MNPALIAAMNFALSRNRNKGQDEEELKEKIKQLTTNISKYYNKLSKSEKLDLATNGYIEDNNIENNIYDLYQNYKVKFNTQNGKFIFPKNN